MTKIIDKNMGGVSYNWRPEDHPVTQTEHIKLRTRRFTMKVLRQKAESAVTICACCRNQSSPKDPHLT